MKTGTDGWLANLLPKLNHMFLGITDLLKYFQLSSGSINIHQQMVQRWNRILKLQTINFSIMYERLIYANSDCIRFNDM